MKPIQLKGRIICLNVKRFYLSFAHFIIMYHMIHRRFRLKWPWEQDRQMAVYNRSSQHIQVASQPERIFMQAKAGIVNGWCLSHLPDAECYISHYCANAKQKQEMRRIYSISNVT